MVVSVEAIDFSNLPLLQFAMRRTIFVPLPIDFEPSAESVAKGVNCLAGS
jgi:hypothetical protein